MTTSSRTLAVLSVPHSQAGLSFELRPTKGLPLSALTLDDDALWAPVVDPAELHLLGVVVLRDSFNNLHVCPHLLDRVDDLTRRRRDM
jgi:hypothetical protein